MEGLIKLYLERAENEIVLAESLFRISSENSLKESLGINLRETFYSAVVSHSYYCIFYSAKAFLLLKGVRTKMPNEHKKTYDEFKRLKNFLDDSLLKIYEEESMKAESLLEIFFEEKRKRGTFTYNKLPQANREPARESLENAGRFFRNINVIIEEHGRKK